MKFLCSGANEEARERIGVDAVRGVGPLRMIRREVNRTAPTAGLGTGWVRRSRWHRVQQGATEVEGNTVTSTYFCGAPLFWYQVYMVRSPHIERDPAMSDPTPVQAAPAQPSLPVGNTDRQNYIDG